MLEGCTDCDACYKEYTEKVETRMGIMDEAITKKATDGLVTMAQLINKGDDTAANCTEQAETYCKGQEFQTQQFKGWARGFAVRVKSLRDIARDSGHWHEAIETAIGTRAELQSCCETTSAWQSGDRGLGSADVVENL